MRRRCAHQLAQLHLGVEVGRRLAATLDTLSSKVVPPSHLWNSFSQLATLHARVSTRVGRAGAEGGARGRLAAGTRARKAGS